MSNPLPGGGTTNALLGTDFNISYGSWLQIANGVTGIDGTLRTMYDGAGNASPLQMSLTTANINGTFKVNGSAITFPAAFTISGAYALTLTLTAATGVTLPTTGTLATLAGIETFTNKTLTSPTLTSPTMTTPILGVVTSGNISACTSTSMVMVTPVLGTVTSGNISACTSTSMVMVTPVLGTPTSGNLSNCTSTSMAQTTPVLNGGAGLTTTSTTLNLLTNTARTVVDYVYTLNTANTTDSTHMIVSGVNTTSNGTSIFSKAFSAKTATNVLKIEINIVVQCATSTDTCVMALFQSGSANSIAATAVQLPGVAYGTPLHLVYYYIPGITTSVTYSVRFGCLTNTATLNESASGTAGSTITSTFSITELTP
jgi:hypothetical protein